MNNEFPQPTPPPSTSWRDRRLDAPKLVPALYRNPRRAACVIAPASRRRPPRLVHGLFPRTTHDGVKNFGGTFDEKVLHDFASRSITSAAPRSARDFPKVDARPARDRRQAANRLLSRHRPRDYGPASDRSPPRHGRRDRRLAPQRHRETFVHYLPTAEALNQGVHNSFREPKSTASPLPRRTAHNIMFLRSPHAVEPVWNRPTTPTPDHRGRKRRHRSRGGY
jgi:hypothetical protein